MTAANNDNPYASPAASDEPIADRLAPCRDGRYVVTNQLCELPRRCMLCNAYGDVRRRLQAKLWVSSSGIRNISIQYFLCYEHKYRLAMRQIAGIGLLLVAGVALTVIGSLIDVPWASRFMAPAIYGTSFLALSAAIACGYFKLTAWSGERPAISKVRGRDVWITNAGEEFLKSLPEYPCWEASDANQQ